MIITSSPDWKLALANSPSPASSAVKQDSLTSTLPCSWGSGCRGSLEIRYSEHTWGKVSWQIIIVYWSKLSFNCFIQFYII